MLNPDYSKRIVAIALLATLVLGLSGCAYIRLLKFKNQLKDFDEYLIVQTANGLSLELKKPVVKNSDLVFITESNPTQKEEAPTSANREIWTWRFHKKIDPSQNSPYAVDFKTHFHDQLLHQLDFDPKLIEIVPPDFLLSMVKSLGKAKISKLRKVISAEVDAEDLDIQKLPTLGEIFDTMGKPSSKAVSKKTHSYEYVFNFLNPDDDSVEGQFTVTFKSKDGKNESPVSGFKMTAKGR
ncbi:MAG: hypothetical protein AAGB46_04740 [Verrucomicrobiota bacterium]